MNIKWHFSAKFCYFTNLYKTRNSSKKTKTKKKNWWFLVLVTKSSKIFCGYLKTQISLYLCTYLICLWNKMLTSRRILYLKRQPNLRVWLLQSLNAILQKDISMSNKQKKNLFHHKLRFPSFVQVENKSGDLLNISTFLLICGPSTTVTSNSHYSFSETGRWCGGKEHGR